MASMNLADLRTAVRMFANDSGTNSIYTTVEVDAAINLALSGLYADIAQQSKPEGRKREYLDATALVHEIDVSAKSWASLQGIFLSETGADLTLDENADVVPYIVEVTPSEINQIIRNNIATSGRVFALRENALILYPAPTVSGVNSVELEVSTYYTKLENVTDIPAIPEVGHPLLAVEAAIMLTMGDAPPNGYLLNQKQEMLGRWARHWGRAAKGTSTPFRFAGLRRGMVRHGLGVGTSKRRTVTYQDQE